MTCTEFLLIRRAVLLVLLLVLLGSSAAADTADETNPSPVFSMLLAAPARVDSSHEGWKTYSEANKICVDAGKTLPVIHSEAENDALLAFYTSWQLKNVDSRYIFAFISSGVTENCNLGVKTCYLKRIEQNWSATNIIAFSPGSSLWSVVGNQYSNLTASGVTDDAAHLAIVQRSTAVFWRPMSTVSDVPFVVCQDHVNTECRNDPEAPTSCSPLSKHSTPEAAAIGATTGFLVGAAILACILFGISLLRRRVAASKVLSRDVCGDGHEKVVIDQP